MQMFGKIEVSGADRKVSGEQRPPIKNASQDEKNKSCDMYQEMQIGSQNEFERITHQSLPNKKYCDSGKKHMMELNYASNRTGYH